MHNAHVIGNEMHNAHMPKIKLSPLKDWHDNMLNAP